MILEEELTKEEIAMFSAENTPLWRLCCALATNLDLSMREIDGLEKVLKIHTKDIDKSLECIRDNGDGILTLKKHIEKHENTVGLHSNTI